MGAADSNDPNLQQLLAKLKINGWLDEKEATKQAKYTWVLGIWSMHCSYIDNHGHGGECGGDNDYSVEFSGSGSVVDGYRIVNGVKHEKPTYRVTILDSGEIRCGHLGTGWNVGNWTDLSCEIADHNQTMKIISSDLHNKHPYKFTDLLHRQ